MTIPLPYGQSGQPQWGQPAPMPQPGQLVPNAHGYLPVPQGTQPYGQPTDPAHQVAAALAPYVDRTVVAASWYGSKSTGAILTACGSRDEHDAPSTGAIGRHTLHAPTSKRLVIPTSSPNSDQTPDVLLLQQAV